MKLRKAKAVLKVSTRMHLVVTLVNNKKLTMAL